jgi:hypothetical protein
MRVRRSVFCWSHLALLTAVALALPVAGRAQDSTPKALPILLGAGVVTFLLIFALLSDVYHALALQTIANKTSTENGWLAWIPIANVILMLNIARKPVWWIVLFFVPIANLVIAILVLMGIAEARNKPNWWGILWIVPVVGIVVPGYLAWSD